MKHALTFFIFSLLLSAARSQDRTTQPPDHFKQITRILKAPPTLHKTASVPGIQLQLRGIYVLDNLIWFVAQVSNHSPIDWRATPMRITIRDRHVWRRRARQELSLPILIRREPSTIPSDSTVILCYAIAPRLPTKGQQLLLEYSERTGDRHLTLRLSGKQLLKAKKLGNDNNVHVHPATQHPPATTTGR